MAWTKPVKYPNDLEITNPEAALNTYVIDNIQHIYDTSGSNYTLWAANAPTTGAVGTINNWSTKVSSPDVTVDSQNIVVSAATGVFLMITITASFTNTDGSNSQTATLTIENDKSSAYRTDSFTLPPNGTGTFTVNVILDSPGTLGQTYRVKAAGTNIEWAKGTTAIFNILS